MSYDVFEDNKGESTVKQLNDREKEILSDASPFEVRQLGRLEPSDIEKMIIGYLVGDPKTVDDQKITSHADEILDSNITPQMFEHQDNAEIFKILIEYYRLNRRLLLPDEAVLQALNSGQTRNDASMLRKFIIGAHATVLVRKVRVAWLLETFVCRHLQKSMDKIYKKAVTDRSNPSVGPRKAWENMRESCLKDLVDPRGGVIKEFDWIKDHTKVISWLTDLKENPEKHKGFGCGIAAIDRKTQGFRPGQLTVFVAPPGGFKSTIMQNVLYGIWKNSFNGLYVSLEMEADNMMLKFWCRHTRKVSYTRAYTGLFSHPEDEKKLAEIEEKIKNGNLSPQELGRLEEKARKYKDIINNRSVTEKTDYAMIQEAAKDFESSPNKLKIITCGQSQKMKLSQLERWLIEHENVFKPDVVVIDYLDLIEPENQNLDRPDIALGDTCKMLRAMGKEHRFSVVSAAQLKRSALERLRKFGVENPEKAQLDTDDIAGSNMIGADSDNVFILWRKPGGNSIKIFTAKARYGEKDVTNGEELQVDYETNSIGAADNIESVDRLVGTKTMADGLAAISKVNNVPELVPGQESFSDDEPVPETGPSMDMDPKLDTRMIDDIEETF